ncbi:MAG: CRISPR-associated endonuclease Cas1 [Iphinoe sp. HA4291-MV1]|jgi:CRISPR-associated protein Cas1|nr:CRISPR-associated endonuclease Cas1 [Iphinoe sp. HA4291-MV1]
MSTIYITEQDASLKIQHHYLKVFHQQKQCICIRIRNVSQIILFGNIHLLKEVMKIVLSHQIPVLYLTPDGEFLGRLENTSQLKRKYLTNQRQHTRDVEVIPSVSELVFHPKIGVAARQHTRDVEAIPSVSFANA